ncbi:MAG: GNAT family N-acetyltransferase [Synechococcus sp.]
MRLHFSSKWDSGEVLPPLGGSEHRQAGLTGLEPDYVVYVSDERNSSLVGYGEAHTSPLHPGVVKIFLATHSQWRRKGVGKAILSYLRNSYPAIALDTIVLASNTDAILFLKKQCFRWIQTVTNFSLKTIEVIQSFSSNDRFSASKITCVNDKILNFIIKTYERKHSWLGETKISPADVELFLLSSDVLSTLGLYIQEKVIGIAIVYCQNNDYEVSIFETNNDEILSRDLIYSLLIHAARLVEEDGGNRFLIEVDSSSVLLNIIIDKIAVERQKYERYRLLPRGNICNPL